MIIFLQTNISYLAENVFKPVLDNKSNIIDLISSTKLPKNSTIDCENCKNYWLIKNNKQNQVINARCKHNSMIKLFDQENQTKLSQKCK